MPGIWSAPRWSTCWFCRSRWCCLSGPVFQGLRQLWRDGESIYVEAQLPETTDVDGFGLHPALLDAVLHGLLAGGSGGGGGLPFAWNGVRLLAGGARHLRAVLTPGAE